MPKIVPDADGTYRATVARKGMATRQQSFTTREAALAWTEDAELAIRDSTLRFGGQRLVVTGGVSLHDYALSCGVLGRAEGGTGRGLADRLAALLGDPLLGLPLAALDGTALAALRARRCGAGGLQEQAILAAAFTRTIGRELRQLAVPQQMPAPDGIVLLGPAQRAALVGEAERSFHPAFPLVLRLALALALPLARACGLTWDEVDLRGGLLRRRDGASQGLPADLADAIERHAAGGGTLFPEASEVRVAAGLAVLGRRLQLGELAPDSLRLSAWHARLADGLHPDCLEA